MPEWLRIALIVLAVLAAVYLIAVIVQVILVKLLRRQAEPMRISIQADQQEVANLAAKIAAIAPAINAGPSEMPFGPLYEQARELLKRGTASLDALREQLATLAANEIPPQPWSDAFKLIPMTNEIARRWRTRRSVKAASAQLAEINDTLARIAQVRTEIDTLPRREKDALLQLQKQIAESAASLENETRPKRPLTEAHALLRAISARVTQADQLLAAAEPSPSAVIAAYPLRTQAEDELRSLNRMIAAAVEERTTAESSLTLLSQRLTAFKSAIATDEGAGCVRTRFAAVAGQLDERVAAIQALIAEGEYAPATSALTEADKVLAAQHEALTALNQERARVAGLVEQAAQRLATVEGWIADTPTRFTRDVAGEAAHRLQALTERLRALMPLEDIERMTEADEMFRQVEEVFSHASQANDDFVAARARFEALIGKLNDENVQSLASSAVRISSELSRTNRNYWGDLTPEAMTTAVESLVARWSTIRRDQPDVIAESALGEKLSQLESVAEVFDHAAVLHAKATQALAQRDADMQQASTRLNDDAMAALLAEVAQIASESPSLAEPSAHIRQQAEALRAEMRTPMPDYRRISDDAERLRQQAAAFVADYRQQLQHTRDQLNALKRRLEEAQDNLNRLREDPRIDFTAQSESGSAAIHEWLSAYTTAIAAPLDAAREALAAGEDVARDASARFAAAMQIAKSIGDQIGPTRAALAELNGTLISAQIGLREMAEFGSVRWGQPMLAPIQERLDDILARLDQLDRPAQKFLPDDAQREITQIEAALGALRAQAAAAHADVARRVAEIRERKARLAQALADGDALAAAQPNLTEAWQRTRQQITDLESQWTHAASYAEALEALTQAVQRAQMFVAGQSARL